MFSSLIVSLGFRLLDKLSYLNLCGLLNKLFHTPNNPDHQKVIGEFRSRWMTINQWISWLLTGSIDSSFVRCHKIVKYAHNNFSHVARLSVLSLSNVGFLDFWTQSSPQHWGLGLWFPHVTPTTGLTLVKSGPQKNPIHSGVDPDHAAGTWTIVLSLWFF